MTGEPIVLGLMREFRSLFATRGGRTPLIALGLAAVVCAFLPLADHVGFELAAVLTIVAAVTCPAAGVAAVRLQSLRPPGERTPTVATVAAILLGFVGVALAAGIILLNAIRRPICEPLAGSAWLLLLPLPTCALATALGAGARTVARSTGRTVLYVIVVEIVSLGWSLSTLYWGPGFFVFDHLFGYLPGPLYDEVVPVTSTVLVFRAMTLLWAVALIVLISASSARERASRATRLLLGGVIIVTLAVVSWRWGTSIGFRTSDTAVAAALGGETQVDDLDIHYPREWNEKTLEQFRRDVAFRAHEVIESLGITPTHRVTVWVYRDADEKRRLVGAAGTSFAKPWRHEVHINSSAFPHSVVRHELVHAFGAEIAGGPFGVPGGLFPNTPLVEGFAVALGNEPEALTLLQQSKAMRDLHIAPDLTALLSASGFLTSAASRAYSYAGAFIRYLQERFGRNKILELYRTGDLRRLGDPAKLVGAFETSLDTVPLAEADRATAARWFSRPSIFHRRCPREVGQINDEAEDLASHGRTQEAIAAFERVCALEPDDPGYLRSMLEAELKTPDQAGVADTTKRLLAHPKLDPSLRATVLTELGDASWRAGRMDEARQRYTEAAVLPVEAQAHRNAYARAQALANPERAELLKPLFVDSNVDVAQLFRMNDYLESHPEDALVTYLLGRQFVQRDAIPRGIPLLEKAARPGSFTDFEMRRETSRLLVRAAAEQHECNEAARFATGLELAADREYADDWIERCRFEAGRGWTSSR